MNRLTRKFRLALVGLVGGFAFACSGPTNPSEMQPLAPRPDPMQPMPTEPARVPKVPDPSDPSGLPGPSPGPTIPSRDAAILPETPQSISSQFQGSRSVDPPASDANTADALPPVDAQLPPLPDGGVPQDANRRAE